MWTAPGISACVTDKCAAQKWQSTCGKLFEVLLTAPARVLQMEFSWDALQTDEFVGPSKTVHGFEWCAHMTVQQRSSVFGGHVPGCVPVTGMSMSMRFQIASFVACPTTQPAHASSSCALVHLLTYVCTSCTSCVQMHEGHCVQGYHGLQD